MSAFEEIKQELLAWSNPTGMSPSVLLQLSEPLRSTLQLIMRRGSVTFAELSEELGLDMPETEAVADLLVDCGFLKTSEEGSQGETVYRIRHSRTHRPESAVAAWNVLLGGEEPSEDEERQSET